MRFWGLTLGVVALGAAVVAAVIVFMFGGGEPDFDEAMHQLVRKPGVGAAQRVTISQLVLPNPYGLLAMPEDYTQGPPGAARVSAAGSQLARVR